MKSNLTENLYNSYSKYFEKSLINKRFTHDNILPLIKNLNDKYFKIKPLGFSIEQREIYSIAFGKGKTTVLLWSQMHGDEPTSTMALFDIFNFLNSKDEFDEFRYSIKQNLKLIFVPMLNPDGTEKIIRQNAIGIDINRDAKRLQAPESQILLDLVEKYKPAFAFNLHDQDFRWSVGTNNKLAAISLLAPVYDYNKSINESRSDAIKLVADLRSEFEKYLPEQIGRYKDDFEPRSFGDFISGKKTSTVLIESGREVNDINKSFYRKINFLMILSSFDKIITKSYRNRNVEEYFNIPTNGNFMFDLILRNVNLKLNNKKYIIDVAINREEIYEDNSRIPGLKSNIMEIGDLSTLNGIEEFDCSDLDFEEGKVSQSVYESLSEFNNENIRHLLSKGILFVKLNDELKERQFVNLPFNVLRKSSNYFGKTALNLPANFNFYKNGKIVKYIINGWLCDANDFDKIKNGLVF